MLLILHLYPICVAGVTTILDHHSTLEVRLQQLQVSRHAVDHTLRSQNSKHRPASTGDLCPARIGDDPGAETQADSLCLQGLHFLLRLGLERNLSLSLRFPAAQHRRVRRVRSEVLVAGEGGVGALSGDFAYQHI